MGSSYVLDESILPEDAAKSMTDEPKGVVYLFDLWYTLIYQTAKERARYAAERRRVWRTGFLAADGGSLDASRWLSLLEIESRRQEAAGHSWPIDRQVKWLSRAARLPLEIPRIEEGIRRSLGRARVRMVPGSIRLLTRLQESGHQLGLVSNVLNETSESTHELLTRVGLEGRFQSVVLSSDLPYAKPSPEPLRRCLAQLKASASRSVHVGDLPSDLHAAERAGVAGILFTGVDREGPRADRAARRPFMHAERAVGRLGEVPSRAATLLCRESGGH